MVKILICIKNNIYFCKIEKKYLEKVDVKSLIAHTQDKLFFLFQICSKKTYVKACIENLLVKANTYVKKI